MKIIGLTGGIGSGKTSILNLFQKKKIPCFNSDLVARSLMNKEKLRKDIEKLFGLDLYQEGKLNRKRISHIVFNDKKKLSLLNSIVHPEVRKEFKNFIKINKNYDFVVYETALLFESGYYKNCDFIILVCATYEGRIDRLIKRDNLSRLEIVKRINLQWSDQKKTDLSDFIINNNIWERTLLEFDCLFKLLKN